MTNGALLAQIANPVVANPSGAYYDARNAAQDRTLTNETALQKLAASKQNMQVQQSQDARAQELANQRMTASQQQVAASKQSMNTNAATEQSRKEAETLRNAALNIFGALSMEPGADRNKVLQNTLDTAEKGSAMEAVLKDVIATKDPKEQDTKLFAIVHKAQDTGILPKRQGALKTKEQLQQELDIKGKSADASMLSAKTGAFKAAQPQNQPTPTDIDDFVADANQASIDAGHGPLSAEDRNKARLAIKRPQAKEITVNKFAEKNVDAATAERIKFNEKLGTQLALIQTAADLLEAKGEPTPKDKIATAKNRMDSNLSKLTEHYLNLDSAGAMLNVENSTFSNVLAATRASTIGQQFGRITGTREQSLRASINKIKPLLMTDIKQATDMGARGMDSVKELEFYLQAATNEKTDLQSNLAAIAVLDRAYGNGKVADSIDSMVDKGAYARIKAKGTEILGTGKRQAPSALGNLSEMSDTQLLEALNAN